tara:strand:+ start:406 stop:618 length:213 start_codon:yes stop_codon:yes gene_type:complete
MSYNIETKILFRVEFNSEIAPGLSTLFVIADDLKDVSYRLPKLPEGLLIDSISKMRIPAFHRKGVKQEAV